MQLSNDLDCQGKPGQRCIQAYGSDPSCATMACGADGKVLVDGKPCDHSALLALLLRVSVELHDSSMTSGRHMCMQATVKVRQHVLHRPPKTRALLSCAAAPPCTSLHMPCCKARIPHQAEDLCAGKMRCPDEKVFCDKPGLLTCGGKLNDCSGRGDCVEGHCFCHLGYGGEKCDVPICTTGCGDVRSELAFLLIFGCMLALCMAACTMGYDDTRPWQLVWLDLCSLECSVWQSAAGCDNVCRHFQPRFCLESVHYRAGVAMWLVVRRAQVHNWLQQHAPP